MERQPPLTVTEEGMSVIMQAAFLPSTDQYSTVIRHFPGNNAHAPWGLHGSFFFEVKIFENGKLVGTGRSAVCDETGSLEMNVGEVAERCGHAVKGMFVVEYHHAKDIPIELYVFYIHKSSGTYLACNAGMFAGDMLYPRVHTEQMENTLFWPGMLTNTENEMRLLIINPYHVKMGFQIHVFGKGEVLDRSKMIHLMPKHAQDFPVFNPYNNSEHDITDVSEDISFCVSSQYKLVAYVMFKSRKSQIMTMLDHMHNFCLA